MLNFFASQVQRTETSWPHLLFWTSSSPLLLLSTGWTAGWDIYLCNLLKERWWRSASFKHTVSLLITIIVLTYYYEMSSKHPFTELHSYRKICHTEGLFKASFQYFCIEAATSRHTVFTVFVLHFHAKQFPVFCVFNVV